MLIEKLNWVCSKLFNMNQSSYGIDGF
jgi:hypothetical protein